MTKVAILPTLTSAGVITYHAVTNDKRSQGNTPGQALDALADRLAPVEDSTLVIIQPLRPDRFFDEAQQRRLADLMLWWRAERDSGRVLPASAQQELDQLVEAEVNASAARSASLLLELTQWTHAMNL